MGDNSRERINIKFLCYEFINKMIAQIHTTFGVSDFLRNFTSKSPIHPPPPKKK